MPKRLIAAGMCLLICAGYVSANAQERYTVDKVVAVVGNSAVLYSELEEAAKAMEEDRKKQGYTSDRDPMTEALEGLMMRKLLYTQAQIDSVAINSDYIAQYVEQTLSAMVEEAGSITGLEVKMEKPYYEIRQELKTEAEEMSYAQSMREEIISKVRITPGEVEHFYKTLDEDELPIIPEQYVYAQITRYPTSSTAAKQRVQEQLLEMKERIINGTRFDVLARMYSVDPGSALQGGEMDWMPLDGLVAPFAEALGKLQPGQISEVVETEFGMHIIQLMDKKGDKYKWRHILLRPVYTPEELAQDSRFLDSLANQIRSGAITFAAAAKKYSDDKYSKENGGVVNNHELMEYFNSRNSSTRFMKEDLRVDYPVLHDLKEGEISDAFQTQDMFGNEMTKIVKLISVIPSHTANMETDYLEIEQLALQMKQEDEFEKWLDDKIESIYVRVAPEFRNSDFLNKKWLK